MRGLVAFILLCFFYISDKTAFNADLQAAYNQIETTASSQIKGMP
jgi:hypothetical protein